ncbi:MAG: Gfo/Idh/MocA family oxidoreductase [Gammaproteobacteria bacterium]|nr:Gfo/Idh/MocA family oxidoreductase [Gammaproteobacteria bacterium]
MSRASAPTPAGHATALIVGGGAVGIEFHLPRISANCNVKTVYIVEPDARRRQELAARFRRRGDITLVADLPSSLRHEIAVVATPPKFHEMYVTRLAGQTSRLLIEKPIARTLGETKAIAEQVSSAGTTAFVCHIRRTLDSFRFIREAMTQCLFGELRSVSVHEGGVFSWRAVSMGSFSRDLNGGGVLLDTGPHTLDLLFQVFDALELRRAWMDADMRRGIKAIEANCVLDLEATGGIPVEFVLSRNRRLSNKACFNFAKAVLTADVRDNTLEIATGSGSRLQGVAGSAGARKMEFKDLFDAFYQQYVVPGDNRGVSPREALKVMQIIDDAYAGASLCTGGF